MNKDKDNFLSTAKGIGIIFMVLGHSGTPGLLGKFIYQFHMPLFFFCSGYFLTSILSKNDLIRFYKKRIKSIYIKFLCWSILFLSLHNIFYHLNIYNNIILFQGNPSFLYSTQDILQKAIKNAFSMNEHEQLLRSFWFLKQLFLSSILVSTITFSANKYTHYKHSSLIILFILLIMTLISKYFNWSLPAIWDISLVFMSSTFYMSGHVFRRYHILEKVDNKATITILFLLSIIGLFVLPWTNMLEYTQITVIPFFIVAYAGIIMTLSISKRTEKYSVKYILYYLGQNTMVIFALHMLCFKIGNLIKIAFYDMPIYRLAEFQIIYEHNNYYWIVYTIIGISIPLLIDYMMKLSKTTKKIWNYFV